jgi:transposase
MNGIPGLTQLLAAAGKRIDHWDDTGGRLRVSASSSVTWSICPKCAWRSHQVHGRYHRNLVDRSCFGLPVAISVEIRRFKCGNACCAVRTFAEPLGELATRMQRRTNRLTEALCQIGYSLGGAAAGRLAAHLGIGVSGDTVLRILRRRGCPPSLQPPVVVGIDDWAITRGHRYGTIIVDLERRQPIDVLIGRESTIVAEWLRRHPTVRIVARDRAGAYSEAVQTVNAEVQQVADRWHLVANMREAIERLLLRQHAKLREAATSLSEAIRAESNPVTADSREAPLRLNVWQRLGVQRRAARRARYEEIVRRRDLGESFKQIGRAMELDQRTVGKFVRAGSFPERAPRTSGLTLLDGHRQYVASRTAQGCVNPVLVWNELRSRGFTGSVGTVRGAMARDRAAAAGTAPTTGVPKVPCPSPRRAYAWLVGWHGRHTTQRKLSDHQRFVQTLHRIEPSIAV